MTEGHGETDKWNRPLETKERINIVAIAICFIAVSSYGLWDAWQAQTFSAGIATAAWAGVLLISLCVLAVGLLPSGEGVAKRDELL